MARLRRSMSACGRSREGGERGRDYARGNAREQNRLQVGAGLVYAARLETHPGRARSTVRRELGVGHARRVVLVVLKVVCAFHLSFRQGHEHLVEEGLPRRDTWT
jgi:hypothetical protein